MARIDENNALIIAERRLLNKIYMHPEILDSSEYSHDLFVHNICKSIAKSIDKMTTEGTPLNELSLFQEASRIDINMNLDVIHEVINIESDPDDYITDIVDVLSSAHRSIKSIESINKIETLLKDNPVITPEIKDKLRKEFDAAETAVFHNESNVKDVMTTKEWGDKWSEDYSKRKKGKMYHFADPILDKMVTDGPRPGEGTLLASQSGMGKSTVVLNLANKMINAEIPCMFFSLEMGAISTYDRLLACRCQIPYSEIVNPKDEETYSSISMRVQEERKALDENKRFRFCEDASVSIDDIRKAVIKFQEEIGQQYCIVILDLITMVKDFCETKNGLGLPQTIEMAINKMNALAKELGFHYMATAQLNRAGESERIVDIEDIDKMRPTRSQIKNSGALLERVRTSITLFRKKFYADAYLPDDPETQAMQDTIELSFLKQSNGSVGRQYELFNGETFSLTPWESTTIGDEE